MAQYNTLNVEWSNSQLNKLKCAIKNGTEVTFWLVNLFWLEVLMMKLIFHKLSLTNTQVSKICETFANGSSANIKFLKMQSSKMIQLGGFTYFIGENPVTKISDGIMSLPKSYVNEIAQTAIRKDYKNYKDAFVDTGPSLLGKNTF